MKFEETKLQSVMDPFVQSFATKPVNCKTTLKTIGCKMEKKCAS